MNDYFNLDLKFEGKLIETSKPFTTAAEFVAVAHELASTLKAAPEGEYEVALFVNEEYDNSVFFEKRKDYFANFCMVISEIYYTLEFRFYMD